MAFRCPAAVTAAVKSLQRVENATTKTSSYWSNFTTTCPKDRTPTPKKKSCASILQFRREVHYARKSTPNKTQRKVWEPKHFPINEQLPPTALLRSAKKSKALDIEPEVALNVLRKYIELSHTKPPGWEREVCQEYNITPSTLTLLGLILNKVGDLPKSVLGRCLLISASTLGDPSATIQLLKFGLRTNSLSRPEYRAPIQRLTELASTRPDAMILLGRIYASQDKLELALTLFRRAASTSAPTDGENRVVGEALVYQGEILQRRGKDAAAKEAFQAAALEHDNALGYWYLGQLQEKGSILQEEYFQKAASSGISNAWDALANLYFDRAMSRGSGKTARRPEVSVRSSSLDADMDRVREMAKENIQEAKELRNVRAELKWNVDLGKEWLHLSANAGNWISIVHLASVLKWEGKAEQGLGWLAVAEQAKHPELAEAASDIRKEWEAQANT